MGDGSSIRIYIPQKLGNGMREFVGLDQQDYWRIFLPQVLEKDTDRTYSYLRQLIKDSCQPITMSIIVRGELFIETESHNSCPNSDKSKKRATRIVAEEIVTELIKLPLPERENMLIEILTFCGVLNELYNKVHELIGESGSEGA